MSVGNNSMKLTMNLGIQSYDIIIKRGSLANVGSLCNLNRKVLIVTDENVPCAYSDTLLAQCKEGYCLRLNQGEGTKSLAGLNTVCSELLAHSFSRKDAVVALGGGVIGDLAGFAASMYMRGISFINVPTTSLSQIDSSIGGKTAVNLNGTKNIIGAFYQPELVVIDPNTLVSLPKRHFINGLAEALKAGLMADEELWRIFEEEDINDYLEEILWRSLVIKKNIVEQDEREHGIRATLNFGHTIGHAIESANGLGGLYHGECIALGMLPMVESSAMRRRMRNVYKKLGLVSHIKYNAEEIYSYIAHDKKAAENEITIVKLKDLCKPYLCKVPLAELKTYIGEGIR